jgi:hypothetical protein
MKVSCRTCPLQSERQVVKYGRFERAWLRNSGSEFASVLYGGRENSGFPPFCESGAPWMPKMGTKTPGKSVFPRPDWRQLPSMTEIRSFAKWQYPGGEERKAAL